MNVTRRVRTLMVGAVLFIVLFIAAITMPVPYAILSPGPTFNTLGKDSNGTEVIVLHGKASRPVSGHLNMTTVNVSTADSISVVEAIRGWLLHDQIVVPRSAVYPPGQSEQDVDKQNQQDFTDSRNSAVSAAMCELGYPKSFGIVSLTPASKAKSVLKPGDELISLDGRPITDIKKLSAVLATQTPGASVSVTVRRSGQQLTVPVTLITPQQAGQKGASIGIAVADGCLGPFTVDISLADVGGPSAGMMFALGIIDEAGTRDLTDGAFIAGTGTIDPTGAVGPIGGIQLKMVAARQAGATVFLAPASNCSDVRGNVPKGLKIVKVSTLHGAVQALLDLQQHKSVPSC